MFITSKGTMDKASPELRYRQETEALLRTVRLPDNTLEQTPG